MHSLLKKIGIEKCEKKHFLIIILVGILLVVIAIPTPKSKDKSDEDTLSEIEQVENNVVEDAYQQEVEVKLEQILSQVEGVGEVKAMITLQASNQRLIEKDQQTSGDGIEEITVYKENELGQQPYVYQEIYPVIEGVVIAAQGGDNPIVIKNITEAIQALFEVETHKIKVMKMKFQK